MKILMQILKFVGIFIVGGIIGFAGVSVILAIFDDEFSFSVFLQRIAEIDALPMIGAVAVSMAALVVGVLLHVILHEAGHLIAGLLSGYRFVSFRIFNWVILRDNGKLRVKRFGISGTGGQCLLTPPDCDVENIPMVWYNLGGVLMNVLLSLAALMVPVFVDGLHAYAIEALTIFIFVGIFLAILNGVPMKINGVGNDAENIRELIREPKNRQAFVTQLRANAMIQNGIRPKDMPRDMFDYDKNTDYSNAIMAIIPLMHATMLLDRCEWEAAYEELEAIAGHRKVMMGLLVNELDCELVFAALVTGHTERARELWTGNLQKYATTYSRVMSAKQRLLFAVALYLDSDRAKAQEIYRTVADRQADYLMQGEVLSDLAQMQSLLSEN